MKISELYEALRESWNSDTAKGYWTPRCLEMNQCAVTAMIVQDYFGGDLLRCLTKSGDSHYWNRLPEGEEVDLTWNQFLYSEDWPDKSNFVIRDRAYVDSFPDTISRYNILKERVDNELQRVSAGN